MKTVLVMFDSLNRAMLEPYGCRWTKTPNFQRLAERSVRFTNNYVGSLPCMPARRELHTGRYNFLHRSWGPLEPWDDSMPELLKDHGVYSHLVTDHIHYWEDGGATYHTRYSSWEIVRGQEGDHWKVLPELFGNTRDFQNLDGKYFPATCRLHKQDRVNRKFLDSEEKMPMAVTFRNGFEFIENHHHLDRWFLQIECFDPHEPFYTQQAFKDLYPHDYDGGIYDWPPYHHVTEDANTARHLKMEYAALLSMCDHYLGLLLDLFDRYDLWKDTMLIVNTDHGYLLGEHGWWSKTVMPAYDEISHTPLFLHDPRFSCQGETRDALVQLIDIPATVLEFFNIPLPRDMQGRPLKPVLAKNQAIRDYALFGYHGAHVNVTDGEYVYMKAPKNDDNHPLYDYTLMPTHMRSRFGTEELKHAELVAPLPFSKGCPVLRIPCATNRHSKDFSALLLDENNDSATGTIDNNSLINAANFGDKLFHTGQDPRQEHELEDIPAEVKMANLLVRAMKESDAPPEQFARLGLPAGRVVTENDVLAIHEEAAKKTQPLVLTDYQWTRSAVNAYRALLKFVPPEQRQSAAESLQANLTRAAGRYIDHTLVLDEIQTIIPEEYRDMVAYFVELASRIF